MSRLVGTYKRRTFTFVKIELATDSGIELHALHIIMNGFSIKNVKIQVGI